ncbi:MAG: TonB-dependent receptor [Acidobacteriota bacterium]|nr:TonB-dependent receptor [Acidobacteriota bacterium]
MQIRKHLVALTFCLCALTIGGLAQSGGTLRGKVTLANNGDPVHNVKVTIIQLRLSTETAEDGTYEFKNVPAGKYDVSAHLERTPDILTKAEISNGQTITADFEIRLEAVREQVTVTATGNEETTFNAIQSVTIIGSLDLAKKNPISLGEALDHELGVAKRSFGPGNSRPVVRGFDGDRVLVLQEGISIGGLGFQSGDHGEPIDLLSQDRIEVVKGPGTLLYGSNAIGGVVNAVSGHDEAHKGVRGYVTGILGSTNDQHGGSAGIEFGTERWLFWANGGGQRTTDYNTPIGPIQNSFSRYGNWSGGFGHFGDKGFLSLSYTGDRRNYGIPTEPEHEGEEEEEEEEGHGHEMVRLNPRRDSLQIRAGFRDLGSAINGGNFTLQYNNYRHDEIELPSEEIGTQFKNKTFLYRAVFDQRRSGRYSGSFGFSGLHRDFTAIGEEALAPPTTQNNFAAFGLQTIDFDRFAFQFGGRVERNAYSPDGLRDRSFTGFSGSAGIRVGLGGNTNFVANYTHSYRAPALEELYNNGPHAGNLTFEIGDENLDRERGNGIDLGLRHNSRRVRAEANFFYYKINDFVFLAPTGEIEDGLVEANYAQGDSRFTGTELRFDVGLTNSLWLLSSLDYVNSELTNTSTPLPRIPPLRARVGFEAFAKGFRINPEVVMAQDQNRLFTTEERTAGYATVNVNASYTYTQKHYAHIFSVNAFNLNDKLFRNHLSFIKEFAPEIGRGIRLVYTLRFF